MRTGYTGHITAVEWRWVTVVSISLVLAAFMPFLWILVTGLADSDWQFMGALHDYNDAAVLLARVSQGTEDQWLMRFLHTPEAQSGTFIGFVYALLGQLARLINLPSVVVFHVARIGASLFMYMALYQLAASIWMRVRTRRIFFAFVAVGGGLGWLTTPLFKTLDTPDLIYPQAYPFFSSLANVHYPLTIACLALLVSVAAIVFRPGMEAPPSIQNGGVLVFLGGLILTFIYPEAVLPILLSFAIVTAITWYQHRDDVRSNLRWLIWFAVPALPMTAYYIAVLVYNDIVSDIWMQSMAEMPSGPLPFLIGFGTILLIALPGLARAIRRFEADGDQFMLVWLVVIVVMTYLPGFHAGVLVGVMIPLAYFATRATEDFWFDHIKRPQRLRVMVALLPILAASHIFVLLLPIRPMLGGDFADASGLLLRGDYTRAFDWMESRVRNDDVILAAPDVALWVPAWTGGRVVYGHRVETVDAEEKERAVIDWYSSDDADTCRALLDGAFHHESSRYRVGYVVYGPEERALGDTSCLDLLTPVRQFDDVVIFRYEPSQALNRPSDRP